MGEVDLFSAAPGAADAALSVVEVTRRARQLIDAGFARVWVRGEISSFKSYRSGHWYFSLRDAEAQVRCVMWRTDNERLPAPEDGQQVFAFVQPTVWEERGEFRLTVRQLLPSTSDGAWERELAKAKAALQQDGLLDPARKRALPRYPQRIAVVTSPDGAALHDIVAVLRKRWPVARVLVVPVRVQGETAEREVVRGLKLVAELDADVVIVGRGGGSKEDLWTFNREAVARAVAAVPVPVVSAVGHETDSTLTDLVADVRAATPSAAAELVAPDRVAIIGMVDTYARRLAQGLSGRVTLGLQRLARSGDRLNAAMDRRMDRSRHRLGEAAARLDALSPLRVLERGFAVARDHEGRVLSHVADFGADPFTLTVRDGRIAARPVR
ncbi:MAG: exodeoxyribonuclease VII large subunit [Gemmatimonadales bacterium]